MPALLKQKNQFLKECFNKIPELAPFKDQGLDLLHKTMNLADRRHDLIHGTLKDMAPPDRIFHLTVVKTKDDKHTIKEVEFNPACYPKLERSLSDLLTGAIEYSQKLANRFLGFTQ